MSFVLFRIFTSVFTFRKWVYPESFYFLALQSELNCIYLSKDLLHTYNRSFCITAQDGTLISLPFEGHTKLCCSVTFSPDGWQIVSGSGDNTIRIWDTQLGTDMFGPMKGHTNTVASVTYSPDGS